MPIPALVGGLASGLAGGVAGAISSAGDRDAARQAALSAFQQYQSLGTPPDLAIPLVLQNLQQQGMLDPQLEQEIKQGPTQLANIQENQNYKNAQLSALASLQKQGAGGFTPEERASLEKIRSQIAGDTEAKRQQIIQNMQQRGLAGGGAELASALQAAQSGANTESQQGLNIAAMGQQNALQALAQAGSLGGQMQQQEFNMAAQKAHAQDIINQFNTQNALSQQARNIQSQNLAQAQNLAEKQRVSDYNAMLANQEQARQRAAQQQNWQNAMQLAGSKAGAQLGQAGYLGQQAQQTGQQWQNIGQGLASGFGAIGTAAQNQDFLNFLKNKYSGGQGGLEASSTQQVPASSSSSYTMG